MTLWSVMRIGGRWKKSEICTREKRKQRSVQAGQERCVSMTGKQTLIVGMQGAEVKKVAEFTYLRLTLQRNEEH